MDAARELDTTARFLSLESRILPGVRRVVNVTTPAAGAQWKATVPGGVMWRLLGGGATITNSNAVANRFPGIGVTQFGVLVYANYFNNNIAASAVKPIIYMDNTALNIASTPDNLIPVTFQCNWLTPGDFIASRTPGFDAGDQYSAVTLLVEEMYATDNQLSAVAEGRYETELAIEAAALQAAGTSSRPGG